MDVINYIHVALTHWDRVTHICVSKLTIIGTNNGLSPGRRQAIIWTNAGILLIGHLGTNFSEILIRIHTFSFKKMHLKMSSAKWRPFCLGLNVLKLNHVSKRWPWYCRIAIQWHGLVPQRTHDAIITSLWRRFGFIMTLLLRRVPIGVRFIVKFHTLDRAVSL